jgi:putative transposase
MRQAKLLEPYKRIKRSGEGREYLKLVGIRQEFSHVATPQENAHVEAWHGILKRDLLDRVEYHIFQEIEQKIDRYMYFYNHVRLHGKLGKITPEHKWQQDKHKRPVKVEVMTA